MRIFLRWTALFLSGGGVGWLIGLSVSPVLQVFVAGILTVVVGVTSALAGVETSAAAPASSEEKSTIEVPPPSRRTPRRNVTPVPLALCILGVVAGASLGVYARTHEWLGADPQRLAKKWRMTGLTDQEISRRLFDQVYPPGTPSPEPAKKAGRAESGSKSEKAESGDGAGKSHLGVLFSGLPAGECTEFLSVSGPDLRRMMLASQEEHIRQFAQQCKSDAALKAAVENLLCRQSP